MQSDSKPKKQSKLTKPLQLNKETLRQLKDEHLEGVVGGNAATRPCGTMYSCFTYEINCTYP
ncbi:class I lanthipeptide [Archangium sp.]|jgi:hypothetical protein|uniref:class I lanthipeptide n=1 Tax=Archangium sp. TaxID=1872627 RepID=UPI002EDB0877